MLQNKKLLLSIIAALAFLRFVWVPWLAHLEEKQGELQTLTRRVERSITLVQQRELLTENHSHAQNDVSEVLKAFPLVADKGQYALNVQRELQALAEQNQVTISLFDWVSDTPLSVFDLQRGRLTVRLEGEVAHLIQMQSAIERNFSNFIVREFRGSWRTNLTAGAMAEWSMQLDADYRLGEGQ